MPALLDPPRHAAPVCLATSDLAVVLVSYRVPEKRLHEHFRWNEWLYAQTRAEVLVVTDREYDLPACARCLVYPEPMEIFSLSKTKNFGIRRALDLGFDVIAETDVDVAWSAAAIRAAATVEQRRAIVPVCRMAVDYESCAVKSRPDYGMACTVAMTAPDWRRVGFDETYEGYGGEDGKLLKDIGRAGIMVCRQNVVYHIAHDPAAPQVNQPGHGRADCWNRASGFNPDRFGANASLINGPAARQ